MYWVGNLDLYCNMNNKIGEEINFLEFTWGDSLFMPIMYYSQLWILHVLNYQNLNYKNYKANNSYDNTLCMF